MKFKTNKIDPNNIKIGEYYEIKAEVGYHSSFSFNGIVKIKAHYRLGSYRNLHWFWVKGLSS